MANWCRGREKVATGCFETEAGGVISEFCPGSFETEADGALSEVRPGSFETVADGVMSEFETDAGGALSKIAKSVDFPVLQRLEHPCRSVVVRSRPLRARAVVERRAKRRAVPEVGSDFEAAFTHCANHLVRSDRVSVILHESQSCCMTRTPQNSQTHNSLN